MEAALPEPHAHPDGAALTWLHVGDLHMDAAHPDRRLALERVVDEARHFAGALDFAFLPGDNADNGTAEQYRLVRAALDRLRLPLRIIPGDHDFEPRSLDAYHGVRGAARLPAAATISGHRCVFLDIVSAGTGGPDFRLGAGQLAWLEGELTGASVRGETVALFMHSYPADLGADAAPLGRLLDRHPPAIIDMGHTHYNELGNDGRTIYAATRSTGQAEEGPAGFSVSAVDQGAVSWRFKPLDSPWPLVLITAPADRRLATRRPGMARPAGTIRARAWHEAGIVRATCRIDDAAPVEMRERDGVWSCPWSAPGDGEHRIAVRAETASGAAGEDTILAGGPPGATHAPAGSDAHAIGAWEDRNILGTQLGPNRNGRKW